MVNVYPVGKDRIFGQIWRAHELGPINSGKLNKNAGFGTPENY